MILLAALLAGCPRPAPTPPVEPTVLEAAGLRPPESPRGDVVDDYHGTLVPDPYRWLEDPDSDATRAWVEAQSALTRDFLATLPDREAIRARLTAVWSHPQAEPALARGDRLFWTETDGVQDQPALWVAEGSEPPRVLLDPNPLSPDGTVALVGWVPSWNGRLVAYSLSEDGSDWVTWHVREVDTGRDLPDVLSWARSSGRVSWSRDDSGFWYVDHEPLSDPAEQRVIDPRLRYHLLGADPSRDPLVLAWPDEPEWAFGTDVTDDGTTLVLHVWRGTERKTQVHVKDLTVPDAPFVPVVGTAWDGFYSVLGMRGRSLWIETDAGAPRGRVIRVDLDHPEPERWVEIVPEAVEALDTATMVGDTVFAQYLRDAHSVVRRYGLDGAPRGEVALPGLGTVWGFAGDASSTATFYAYGDFVQPPSVYRYDLATGRSELFRESGVDVDRERFVVEQVFATSKDGTRVPMFVVRRADLPLDGARPTLMYGYGGFDWSITPYFFPESLVWAEMGGVVVATNLRGGGEYGAAWHEAGMLDHKQNVFDDFVACAEWLVANGVTRPDKLAIQGYSNGGLLVGAVLEQRPDLFGAALPAVGVMDMLRYHRFTIGSKWATEYGTSDDPAMFPHLLAYSPVHNARPARYPATLVTTADHDDRVVPAHSYKFTAALQAAQRGPAPILLRVATDAGHGATTARSAQIAEITDQWAFLVWALGMDPDLPPISPP